MGDGYIEKFRKAIKDSNTDKEVDVVLDRVYSDGFEDGSNEG